MKQAKVIKKLSLAYWEVYSRKLNLAAAAKDWREAGGKKASRPITRQMKKTEHTLDGIVLSAKALGISLKELQTAKNETSERR